MGHGIEKAPDIRVKHPVHLPPENADIESVQRIVLAASRPESVGEPEEVLLVDGLENRRDRLLDDFILQAQNAQRALRAISLRNVGSSGRMRPVTAAVHLIVQFLQLLFEVFSIGLPRHAVDARRRVPFKREVTLLQEIGGDVMQQCCEPYTLAQSRRSAHGDEPVRRGAPAQCPGRGRLAAVPLGRGPSLHGLRRGNALVVRPLHRYNSLVRLLIRVHAHRSAFAFMSRAGVPCRSRKRPPRYRAKNFSTCTRSSDCARFSHPSQYAMGDIAFSASERDRHLGIDRFAAQYLARGLPCERFTAALASRTSCITRGRGGWLNLPRGGLPPPILCQLPGAHRFGSRREELTVSIRRPLLTRLPTWEQTSVDFAFGSMLLKKGSRFLATRDSVCLILAETETGHDGPTDQRSAPTVLSI